jgi:hypothetical protein
VAAGSFTTDITAIRKRDDIVDLLGVWLGV